MTLVKQGLRIFIMVSMFCFSIKHVQAAYSHYEQNAFAAMLATMLLENQFNQVSTNENHASVDTTVQDDYLDQKIKFLPISKDINLPMVERLLFQAVGGHIPTHQQYDIYVNAAYELAQQDGIPLNMQHITTAIHTIRGEKIDFKIDVIDKRAIAIHELGHAIAIIYKLYKSSVLDYVEVESRKVSPQFATVGHNIALPIQAIKTPHDELYNNIIVALSGGIAVQVFTGIDKNLHALLLDDDCRSDVQVAYDYARTIATHEILQDSPYRLIPFYTDSKIYFDQFDECERAILKTKIDEIIKQCYDEAYQFITDHTQDIELAIDLLQTQGAISGDDLYDLFKADKPLYDFEQGPLPKKLVANYALRGKSNKYGSADL